MFDNFLNVAKEGVERIAKDAGGDQPDVASDRELEQGSISADKLCRIKFPDRRDIVEEKLPEGMSLLVAPPKVGKSWLGLNLSLSVATGQPFFTSKVVSEKEVLYVALEDSERRLKERILKLTDEPPSTLHLQTAMRPLDQGGREDLEEWLQAHPSCGLVVIDTLARVHPEVKKNQNIYLADAKLGAMLQKIAFKYHIALLIIHHTNKRAKQQVDDILETISGSQGLAGSADTIWILKRPRNQAKGTLFVTGRDIEESTLDLLFDVTQGKWNLDGTHNRVMLSPERQEIIDWLRQKGPLAPVDLGKFTGKTNEAIRQLLLKMKREEQVFQTKDGKYGINPITAIPNNGGNSDNAKTE